MAKPKRDPIREDRIQNEVIVDAYGPEEQAMGWYYYLEDRLKFPFQARCVVAKVVSPLRKGEAVEVRSIAPEDACQSDMLVLICWQGRSLAVPYLNWPPLAGTYQPPRPSLIGIRWRKVTVSELRCLVPTYPGLPEGHNSGPEFSPAIETSRSHS